MPRGLFIHNDCIEVVSDTNLGSQNHQIIGIKKATPIEDLYRVAQIFKLTPESIQELLDLLGTEFK